MPSNTNRLPENKKQNKANKINKYSDMGLEPALKEIDPEEVIFALDIGTRTVVGIVGFQEKDKFKVISTDVIEHKNRAMLDGQIHDINQVADVVKEIREKLEKKTGLSLTKVAIAAAGRVLKTCEVKVEREIEPGKEIDRDLVSSIEMEGIQLAQLKLDNEIAKEEKTQYYCVGYSVINYYLNDYIISTLLGHKGRKIGADILATFLPHIVVDSLYTVMNKVGLEVTSLTLEPIAAINVTIPRDLWLLNLVLVDIGAGTSDIAITRNGSVVAYAMVPVAGDEITEKIAHHYLVDFNTGEKIKVSLSSLSSKDTVTFEDILSRKHIVPVSEVLEVINPSVRYLAETISQRILEYNHKTPNAVFLIGGGSQVPGLTTMIAEHLGLPLDRVVVRGRDAIQNIRFSGKRLMGPEAITPFGIAITAQMQKGRDFLTVTINGSKIRLFNSKRLTVADALILMGFNANQLIGRSGRSISFSLNGVRKVARGQPGKPAEIFVNDKPASLETALNAGDEIKVVPAEDGADAQVRVSDYKKAVEIINVIFNGSAISAGTRVYINGKAAGIESIISEGDMVYIEEIRYLGDLIKLSEVDMHDCSILVNGRETGYDYELRDGDVVECLNKKEEPESSGQEDDAEKQSPAGFEINSMPVEATMEEKYQNSLEYLNPGCISVVVNGQRVVLSGSKAQYIFVDIFNYIEFDLSKPQGSIVLLLNGRSASFTDTIGPGDEIEIYWDKK